MLSSYTCRHVIRVLNCTWFSQTKTWFPQCSFIYLFNSQLILFQLSFNFDQIYAFYGIWFKRDDFCFRFFRMYVFMYVCLFFFLFSESCGKTISGSILNRYRQATWF